MYKRLLAALLMLLMLGTVSVAEEPAPSEVPVLVDRINAPEVYADFAFALLHQKTAG